MDEGSLRSHRKVGCGCNSLGVSLEHVDRVDGGVSEVPQTEGGGSGRGDHQTLGGVGAAMGQLLVVACARTHTEVR